MPACTRQLVPMILVGVVVTIGVAWGSSLLVDAVPLNANLPARTGAIHRDPSRWNVRIVERVGSTFLAYRHSVRSPLPALLPRDADAICFLVERPAGPERGAAWCSGHQRLFGPFTSADLPAEMVMD